MIPLCTPTTPDSTAPLAEPEQLPLTCGCAFTRLGSPWVAQRVWPMPQVPVRVRPWSVLSARWYSLPVAFTTSASASPSRTASPAESYPRYSSLDSPSSRIGAACRRPVNPTIPHMLRFPRRQTKIKAKAAPTGPLCLVPVDDTMIAAPCQYVIIHYTFFLYTRKTGGAPPALFFGCFALDISPAVAYNPSIPRRRKGVLNTLAPPFFVPSGTAGKKAKRK